MTPEPLFLLQARALNDTAAAKECATRYAAREGIGLSDTYKRRLAKHYLLGFNGEPDPYAAGRGGNFVRGLRRAYRDGAALRSELLHPVTEQAE